MEYSDNNLFPSGLDGRVVETVGAKKYFSEQPPQEFTFGPRCTQNRLSHCENLNRRGIWSIRPAVIDAERLSVEL